MTSVIRYTPERIAFEDTKMQITALEMGIDVWMRLKTQALVTTWKIGMIQGLLDSDQEETEECLACETGCDIGHTYDKNCSSYHRDTYGTMY